MRILRLVLCFALVTLLAVGFVASQVSAQSGRFPGQPWPLEIVKEAPFKFKPSASHRQGVLFPWSVLVLKEQTEPTFKGGELQITDAKLAGYWRELYPQLAASSRRAQVSYVNHFMNQFKYGEDIDVWGVPEYWATPREYMEKRIGDCKAIAIAKYFALRSLGVPADDMYLTTVNITGQPRGDYHLVLAVFDGADLYVLDMHDDRGVTVNSAYSRYTVYDYFNENVSREIISGP